MFYHRLYEDVHDSRSSPLVQCYLFQIKLQRKLFLLFTILPDLSAPHRRFDQVWAPAYLGRKRGEIARTRTTVLQAHSHQWLGTFSGAGNGSDREEKRVGQFGLSSCGKSHEMPWNYHQARACHFTRMAPLMNRTGVKSNCTMKRMNVTRIIAKT
jgi:hypothetical protein